MAIEHTNPLTSSDRAAPESNGHGTPDARELCSVVALVRARCSNLRHLCRRLLDDPSAAGVLDERTVANLRDTAPEVTELEGQTVVALLARGGTVPPTHPLAPKTDDDTLRTALTSLTAEHERLRTAFFALYDHLHPGDDLTDDDFFALQSHGPLHAMSDVVAEIEREF